MRAGRLRRRVRLDLNVPIKNTDGGKVDSWVGQDEVAAEVRQLRGREFMAAREFHSEVTARVIIRYRPDIAVEPLRWRVVTVDVPPEHVYQIEHVVDLDGRFRDLELLCSEVT